MSTPEGDGYEGRDGLHTRSTSRADEQQQEQQPPDTTSQANRNRLQGFFAVKRPGHDAVLSRSQSHRDAPSSSTSDRAGLNALPRLSAIARNHAALKRNNTVQGVGSAERDDSDQEDDERGKARVTLMRKLSERRLQSRNKGNDSLQDDFQEWKQAAEQRAQDLVAASITDSSRSSVSNASNSPRNIDWSAGGPTPRVPEHAFEASKRRSSIPAYMYSSLSSASAASSLSSMPVERPTGPSTFGIAAVEGRGGEDGVRRRGSSASSTLPWHDSPFNQKNGTRLASNEPARMGSMSVSLNSSIRSGNGLESPRSSMSLSKDGHVEMQQQQQHRQSIDQAFAAMPRDRNSATFVEHIMRRQAQDQRRRHSVDSAKMLQASPHHSIKEDLRPTSPLALDVSTVPPSPLLVEKTPKPDDNAWSSFRKQRDDPSKTIFERRSPIAPSSGSSEKTSPVFTPSFQSLPTFAPTRETEPLVSPHSLIPPEANDYNEQDDEVDPRAAQRAQMANKHPPVTPTPQSLPTIETDLVPRTNNERPIVEPYKPLNKPGESILKRLDQILGTTQLESPSSKTPLDDAPRKLLLDIPVLQVVNAYTVKDRHLFLFTDCLLIAKPIIEDDPVTGAPTPSTRQNSFIVKSVVELRHLNLHAGEDAQDEASSSSSKTKKKHPLLVAFVDRFANDPKRAINSLVHRGGLSNHPTTIANLLFRNSDLNRNQLGAYLSNTDHRPVLRAFIDRFRFTGVRLDDALRMFLQSLRLPHDVNAVEYVLGILAMQWSEANSSTGFDPTLTYKLARAIMALSDALHGGKNGTEDGLFSFPNRAISVEDFISSFRASDSRDLVPEELLTSIYTAVSKLRIEAGNDNSMFSMTPDIEASIEPARLPSRLTYKVPSQVITITIPEPDPHFYIKLTGLDLKFEPSHLVFSKSRKQSFRVVGTALGMRAMVFIKLGANAPRYQGLPINKAFSIERAFMQHTFQVSFVNHLDVKRKYMFSTMDAEIRNVWLKCVREQIAKNVTKPPLPSKALQAGEAVAYQVLRDALIAPEPRAAQHNQRFLNAVAAPSPRPGSAGRFGPAQTAPLARTGGRLGTPTRTGTPQRPSTTAHAAAMAAAAAAAAAASSATLVRSNSFSRTYAAGIGRAESDLISDDKRKGLAAGSSSNAAAAGPMAPAMTPSTSLSGRRHSREDDAAKLKADPFCKTGQELVTLVEQNSLLPVVLSFLGSAVPPSSQTAVSATSTLSSASALSPSSSSINTSRPTQWA